MARTEAEVGKPQGGLVNWIDDRFPGARFIHLVRDGRAVALSHGKRLLARRPAGGAAASPGVSPSPSTSGSAVGEAGRGGVGGPPEIATGVAAPPRSTSAPVPSMSSPSVRVIDAPRTRPPEPGRGASSAPPPAGSG